MLILVLLVWTIAPSPVSGSRPLSLAELIEIGLQENLGLELSRVEMSLRGQDVIIEDAQFDSRLFADGAFSLSSSPLALYGSTPDTGESEQLSLRSGVARRFSGGLLAELSVETRWLSDNDVTQELDPRYRTTLQIELNQPLLRNFGRDINLVQLRQARSRERQQVLEYLQDAHDLIAQLEIAARRLATGNAVIGLRREAVQLAEILLRANREKYSRGLIAVTQVQEAETAVAERRLALSRARQERDLLFTELNAQLNQQLPESYRSLALENLAVIQLSGADENLDSLYREARKKRLEFKISASRLRRSRLTEKLAQNQLKPQLDLSLSAGLNGLSGDRRDTAAGNPYAGPWVDSLGGVAEHDGFEWRTGLQFSMPLGNREAQARLQQARFQVRAERYQAEDLESRVMNDLQQQLIRLRRGVEQLEIAEDFVRLAQRSLAQEERRVEEGLSDTFRLINFQEKLTDARIRYFETLVNYQLAEAGLARARGLLLQRHGIVLSAAQEEIDLNDF